MSTLTVNEKFDENVTVIRPRRGWIAINWRELWESRELLYFLMLRDIKVRYKQTVLGVAWAVLQPVLSMLVFTVIFGQLAKMPSEGFPYAIFVYTGLLPWTFFSTAVSTSSGSLVNQQALLTKIYLPRLFVPSSAIGSGMVDFAVSFVFFGCLMAYYGVMPGWGLLAVPALVALTIVASLGVGLILAAVTVTYRDFRYVVPFVVQLGLYISPVGFPSSIVPEGWRLLYSLNPMVGVIDGFRWCILGGQHALPFTDVLMSISGVVVLVVSGLWYFRRTERFFADMI